MPKLKNNSGATKRFKRTGSGGFKCRHSYHRHNLTSKTTKRKRHLRDHILLNPSDVREAKRLLPCV